MMLCILTGMLFMPAQNVSASDAKSIPDRKILIDMTQSYFNAVTSKDTHSLRNYLLPEAQFIYRNGEAPDAPIGTTSVADLLANLPGLQRELLERMQKPTVLIQGRIGIVWTRYDFYVDKQFSHCGTDVFTFLKTQDGWKMAGGSWSVEKTTCQTSPLDAPLK